jgi:hypothetical protein
MIEEDRYASTFRKVNADTIDFVSMIVGGQFDMRAIPKTSYLDVGDLDC